MYAYKHWPSSVQGLATRIGARYADAANLMTDIQRRYPYQKELALDCLNFVISTLVMEEWPERLQQFVAEHPPKQLRDDQLWGIVRSETYADYD
jgi:hypothetical protein